MPQLHFLLCIFIDMTDCIIVFLHSKHLSLHYSCKVHLETDKYLPWLTLCDACMAQEKPKNRTQRWSFDESFHTDYKETWVDKKAEDGYKIGGPTTWPSHEANALCQFTWQYSVSMYISPEEWELSGFNLFFEVIWYLLLSFSSNLSFWLNYWLSNICRACKII